MGISIHAPPRGATIAFLLSSRNPRISIHAPPRGATNRLFSLKKQGLISIHAPPRGATSASSYLLQAWIFQFTPLREGRPAVYSDTRTPPNFNSRPSARGDPTAYSPFLLVSALAFQFTPLREGRLAILLTPFAPRNFNSRPSARGDKLSAALSQTKTFQFTPLREGRPIPDDIYSSADFISIHAPPRGATRITR